MLVASEHVDVLGTHRPERRHEREADRSSTDHGNRTSREVARLPDRVHRHGDRLDQRGVGGIDAAGQQHDGRLGDQATFGHAAVDGRPEHPQPGATEVGPTGKAVLTRPAGGEGLDGHEAPVIEPTGELVTEGERQRDRLDQVEIGATHPGRADGHPNAVTRRLGYLHTRHLSICTSHCPHGRIVSERDVPTEVDSEQASTTMHRPKVQACGRLRWTGCVS